MLYFYLASAITVICLVGVAMLRRLPFFRYHFYGANNQAAQQEPAPHPVAVELGNAETWKIKAALQSEADNLPPVVENTHALTDTGELHELHSIDLNSPNPPTGAAAAAGARNFGAKAGHSRSHSNSHVNTSAQRVTISRIDVAPNALPSSPNNGGGSSNGSSAKEQHNVKPLSFYVAVAKRARKYELACGLVYTVTIAVFPGVVSEMESGIGDCAQARAGADSAHSDCCSWLSQGSKSFCSRCSNLATGSDARCCAIPD